LARQLSSQARNNHLSENAEGHSRTKRRVSCCQARAHPNRMAASGWNCLWRFPESGWIATISKL